MTNKASNESEQMRENVLNNETGVQGGQDEPAISGVEGLLKKIAALEEEVAAGKQQAEKFREELFRKAAEFENFRKQKEREVAVAGSRSQENMIRELLPMLDDLKRVIVHTPAELQALTEARPFLDGVELIRKNFIAWLEGRGVKEIEAKGQKLDVNYHEAITQIDHPDAESDTIVDEYQTGYILGDRVIRHAKVIVAR